MAIESCLIGIKALLEVFRMHHLRPAVAKLCLYGATREIEPRLIDVVTQLVSTRHPDHYRGCVLRPGGNAPHSRVWLARLDGAQ